MKDGARSVAIEEFVGLKSKMYLSFVDNSEHKKAKCVSRNVVATTRNNEYKDKLLNKKLQDTQWIEFKVKKTE